MFEHTVVAAHFASSSAPLFQSLEELRERGTQELTLVDVMRSHNSSDVSEAHRVEAQRRLDEERDILERAGFKVNMELRTGQPAHELSAIARARHASLILVGSRGEGTFREFLRGSTVLQLIRKTTTPVLLEPIEPGNRQITGRGFSHLLLATDFSDSAGDAETTALALAEHARRLIILHVVEDDELEDMDEDQAMAQAGEKLERLAGRLGERSGQVQVELTRGSASREIARVARDERASMIIIGKRGHSPIHELMLGSTAQAVFKRATQSILMVPAQLGRI
ncbi:MAG: universal stress protein [Aquisalimonadaceae bacterium]